jgi:hypothetical protein
MLKFSAAACSLQMPLKAAAAVQPPQRNGRQQRSGTITVKNATMHADARLQEAQASQAT